MIMPIIDFAVFNDLSASPAQTYLKLDNGL